MWVAKINKTDHEHTHTYIKSIWSRNSVREAVGPISDERIMRLLKLDGEMAEKLSDFLLLCSLWKVWGMYPCQCPYFEEGSLKII